MSQAPPAAGPATVGELSVRSVARDSWTVFVRDRRSLLVLAAALEVPLLILEVALHVTPGLRSILDNEALVPLVALATVYGSLSHHFLAGVLERVVGIERRGHHRARLREIIRDLPWLRLVIADIVLTTLIALGLTALVVPGLLAMTWFALALPLINLEGLPVRAAFGRSVELVRGHAWRVGFIAIASFVIPETIVAAVVAVTHSGNVLLNGLAHAIPAVIMLPLAALPIVVTTFDLVDMEAERLAPTADDR